MSIPQNPGNDNPSKTITRTPVPENQRLNALPEAFGKSGLILEGKIYDWMESLTADYFGGYWEFYRLSNNGFYMAPKKDTKYHIVNPANYFDGDLSADAAGIAACLFALSHLSFDFPDSVLPERFHQLRDYAAEHAEARLIFRLID